MTIRYNDYNMRAGQGAVTHNSVAVLHDEDCSYLESLPYHYILKRREFSFIINLLRLILKLNKWGTNLSELRMLMSAALQVIL